LRPDGLAAEVRSVIETFIDGEVLMKALAIETRDRHALTVAVSRARELVGAN